MKSEIRIAVVDDHPLFREGVISMLKKSGVFGVLGEGATADDALELARRHPLDIILLDVSMPGDGLEAARRIHLAYPEMAVVMLTISETGADVMGAFECGARGYLLKGISRQELVGMLEAAHRGEMVISPSLGARLLMHDNPDAPRKIPDPVENLTEQQKKVLELVSLGHTNKEIGRLMGLSDRTVKNYMTAIMSRLNVRNRVEATLKVKPQEPT